MLVHMLFMAKTIKEKAYIAVGKKTRKDISHGNDTAENDTNYLTYYEINSLSAP